MRRYFIKTFGCEMNKADSEKIHMILLQSGLRETKTITNTNLVIFNTCSVRKKGEDRVFGLIREIGIINQKREENKEEKIIIGVTGCMIRKTGMNLKYLGNDIIRKKIKNIEYIKNSNGIFNNDDKLFQRIPKLDFSLRIEEMKYLNLILSHIYKEKIGNDDKFDDYLKLAQERENKFSASVIIQTGCDNYCSFCIVPYSRGKEISRNKEDILDEIKKLAKNGTKEISLIGQNVNSYGKQEKFKLWNNEKSKWNDGIGLSPFRELLNEIDKIDGIKRIRFTSSNPHDMTKDILDSHFDLNHTCNYLHFALQSGSNDMLKKMNRKHSYEDFKNMVLYLRNKDPLFSISTDIIVGYSGETDDMFQYTINAIKELEIDFVYIARYSSRAGTIGSKIHPDDIPDKIKAKRWHKLNDILEENVKKRGEKILGTTQEVLISGLKDGNFFGRTRNFKEVFFKNPGYLNIGDIIPVKITKLNNWTLIGEIN